MIRGRYSSVGSELGSLACVVRTSSEPPVEGIFHLELTWVLTPFPQNSFG